MAENFEYSTRKDLASMVTISEAHGEPNTGAMADSVEPEPKTAETLWRRRRRIGLAVFVAATLLVSACGDSSGSDTSLDTNEPGEVQPDGSEPPVSAAPTGDGSGSDLTEDTVISIDDTAGPGEVRALVRRIDVNQVLRYAGFDIEVKDVTFGFDPGGFRVALVSATLTNHTTGPQRLQTAVEIESQNFVAIIDRDMSPEVPAGGSADGAFSLRLDPTFTFDDAVLYVGRSDRQRAQVPLGSVGELITLAPETFTELAGAADDVSSITIDSVTVAWDNTDPRGQADLGTAFLHIVYTLDSSVETAVSKDTIALVDRDGNTVVPVSATILAVEGTPAQLSASFVVVDPPGGDYTLRYTERFGRGEVEVPFSIG